MITKPEMLSGNLSSKGISKPKQDKLEEASKFFNLALKINISNSYLQFLKVKSITLLH